MWIDPVKAIVFEEAYEVNDAGCWVWQRGRGDHGYGTLSRNGKTALAHRVAYEDARGPIPKGKQIDHLCRNRACVNPDHLEIVSNAENAQRGKQARLTPELVREMRASGLGCNALARKYGIDSGHAWRILNRERWANI